MSYNQHQQGFSQNPGGVPHGGIPTFPNVPVGESMQPYLPLMAAKIYTDMAGRGTQYTQYMASLYSANGYHNPVFEEIIVMVADFADYSMATYHRSFNEVIDSVVQDCNNMLLESHHRNNPQKIPVQLTEAEKNRYRAAKTKLDALRMKISEFLKHKVSNMNQYPQHQQQPQFQGGYQQAPQQPQYQGGYPHPQQNQMSVQQQQALWQQQQQQALWQQQQAQQAQHYQQQPYNGGRMPNQPGGSDFAQRVANRMNPQQRQPQYQQPYQPQYQQQGTYTPPMSPQQQWQQQQWQQQQMNQQAYGNQPFQQGQPHPGQFAYNPQQQQHHQPQQQQPNMLSSSGYDPMPMVDETKLHSTQRDNSDPFAANAAIIQQQRGAQQQPQQSNDKPAQATSSFTTGASFSQPTKPNPSTSTLAERKYERKVRAQADELGLPEDASLSYLEAEITRMLPNNGFISSRNAYSEAKTMNHSAPASGPYASNNKDVMTDEQLEVFAIATDYNHDTFAAKVLETTAKGSQGRLVKQPDGTHDWMSYTDIKAFEAQFPGVPLDGIDVKRFKSKPPYEFAVMNMNSEWTVEAKFYKQIPHKGSFTVSAVYPVHSSVGMYVVSDKGVIIDFYSRPKNTTEESNVDYNSHDDRRFFDAMSPKDLNQSADDTRMIEAFANLQVAQKVSEVIDEVERQAGVMSGDNAALIINKTVELEDDVHGNILEDDYYIMAKSAMKDAMGDMEYDTADVSYRYKHVHMYPWYVKGDDLKEVRKLRYKEDYLEIGKILIALSELDNFPASWFNRLNDVATRYVNDVIATQYPLAANEFFHIKSFALDIKDAVDEMEKLGYGDSFEATAKRLTNTLLYVWDNTNPTFSEYFPDVNEDNENDDDDSSKVSTAGFGIVRDITVIPLHSRSLPLYAEKDKCLLTKQGFSKLWEVAHERMQNRDPRVTETIIVTSDNRHMYISETAVEEVYAITKHSILA